MHLIWFSGDVKFASGLQAYLLSRDHSNLKSEFQEGNGKVNADSYLVKLLKNPKIWGVPKCFLLLDEQITVSCVEKLPAVTVVLGDHLHLTVGDYLLSTTNS